MSIIPKGQGASVPCPPIRPPAYLPIMGLRGGRRYRFVILSRHVYGRFFHFDPELNRTFLHPDGPCGYCERGHELRWYGFLAALDSERQKAVLIQITQGAYQYCPSLAAREGELRGKRLEVLRLRSQSNSPMRCLLVDQLCPVNGHPEPDVSVSVLALYGRGETP